MLIYPHSFPPQFEIRVGPLLDLPRSLGIQKHLILDLLNQDLSVFENAVDQDQLRSQPIRMHTVFIPACEKHAKISNLAFQVDLMKIGDECSIMRLFAYCKGGNFNIYIWAWLGYFIC